MSTPEPDDGWVEHQQRMTLSEYGAQADAAAERAGEAGVLDLPTWRLASFVRDVAWAHHPRGGESDYAAAAAELRNATARLVGLADEWAALAYPAAPEPETPWKAELRRIAVGYKARGAAEPEPARVVDGLTVGARYRIEDREGAALAPFGEAQGEPVLFDTKDDGCYWFVGPDRNVKVYIVDVAKGHVAITDLDGNRVDYWAEQARAFLADEAARGMGTPADRSAYEPPAFHALPRVLDEQESTR